MALFLPLVSFKKGALGKNEAIFQTFHTLQKASLQQSYCDNRTTGKQEHKQIFGEKEMVELSSLFSPFFFFFSKCFPSGVL